MSFDEHQTRIWNWFWTEGYTRWYAFGAEFQPQHAAYRYKNWRILNQLVFDTETNGYPKDEWTHDPNPEFRILSYTGDLYVAREVDEQFDLLMDPMIPIDPGATKVHGITDEMVAGQPTFEQRWYQIQEQFADAHVIFAYNGQFDITGLVFECIRNDILYQEYEKVLNKPLIDILIWERERLKRVDRGSKSAKLEEVAKRFGIKYMANVAHGRDSMHNARTDVDVLAALVREMGPQLPWSIEDLTNRQAKAYARQQAYYRKKYGPKEDK